MLSLAASLAPSAHGWNLEACLLPPRACSAARPLAARACEGAVGKTARPVVVWLARSNRSFLFPSFFFVLFPFLPSFFFFGFDVDVDGTRRG